MNTNRRASAQLPQGNAGIWGGISENFEFHSSPESFIASRVLQWQQNNPQAVENRTVVRAKILNRNVAIISSYKHVKSILDAGLSAEDEQCTAYPAYKDLMAQFFPPPNLLLADGCPHATMRQGWDGKMQQAQPRFLNHARVIIDDFLTRTLLDTELDLYEQMKALAWQILMGCFLDEQPESPDFATVQGLQEDLLRGQFSLFPASVNVGFWRSPRKRGIDARKTLQSLIKERVARWKSKGGDCPFRLDGEDEIQQTTDHVLMMTSSLAVKGLASLLTAYLLNLYVFRHEETPLYQEVNQAEGPSRQHDLLRSIYLETERLSPPIVGIMRRLTKDVILEDDTGESDILLPQGWDLWFYFIGATRDEAAFGNDCESFHPYRYLDKSTPQPLGFGLGPKVCLGRSLIRDINMMVAEHMLAKQITIRGEICEPGVKAWLGWSVEGPETWAADMKQLPTQHPKTPIIVQFINS